MDRPNLIEPGVSYFYTKILQQCHNTRLKYYNIMLNASLFFGFIAVLYLVLSYKKRSKIERLEQKEELERQKLNYILTKLSTFNKKKLEERQELITNLPPINNDLLI